MDFKKPRTELSVTFGWLDLDASGGFGLWSSLITDLDWCERNGEIQ
jgi:hypothetical protein